MGVNIFNRRVHVFETCLFMVGPGIPSPGVAILASSAPNWTRLSVRSFALPCMLRGKPRALVKGQAAPHRPVVLLPPPSPAVLGPLSYGFALGAFSVTFLVVIFILIL